MADRLRMCPQIKQDLAVDLKRSMSKEEHMDLQIMQQSGWYEWEGGVWRYTLKIKINLFGVF